MSPGTDFSMYQKVASSTISNVPIDHSRDNHKTPRRASIEPLCSGQANEQNKCRKKRQQILQYKSKIPSNSAQTWTMGEKPKQTLPEHSKGFGRQAVKVKKDNSGCLDNLGG
jgi:hypothetical protein